MCLYFLVPLHTVFITYNAAYSGHPQETDTILYCSGNNAKKTNLYLLSTNMIDFHIYLTPSWLMCRSGENSYRQLTALYSGQSCVYFLSLTASGRVQFSQKVSVPPQMVIIISPLPESRRESVVGSHGRKGISC